jgi:tetratricopeptide (TPR) repeat protein
MRSRGSTERVAPSGWSCRCRAGALLLGLGLLGGGARAAAGDAAGPCAGAEPALRSAAEALDQGLWSEAEKGLQPLSASHADCSDVVLGLARIRAARGEQAEAERLFTRATALAPDDPLALALFARYSLSRGRPARADYLSSLALSRDPDCSEALVVAGQILSRKRRPHAAFAALEKAARVGPNDAEAQYQFGVFLFRRKLHAEAVRQFEKTVALRPLDARAHDFLALGFEAMGEAEPAEQAYRSALEVNDGPFPDPFLHHNYGRFLLKLGRLEESQRQLDRAVALLPNNRAVHYERGKLNLALERYQAAREDAERALSLRDPGGLVLDLQVYYLLATIYTRLGKSELAHRYAELARTTPIPNQD